MLFKLRIWGNIWRNLLQTDTEVYALAEIDMKGGGRQ